VVDVRCSANTSDVKMCDNSNKNKCVKLTDVAKRLTEGWKLGDCTPVLNLNPGACGEPTIPGCACQGGVATVMFQYFGATPNVTIRAYNKKSGSSNLSELIGTFTNKSAGDMFTVSAANAFNNGIFGSKIYLQINGTGTIYEVNTQCGTIAVGTNVGLFSIAQYTDIMQNTCNGDVISCLCQDNLMLLQVKYTGPSGATLRAFDSRNKTTLIKQFDNVQQGDTLLLNGSLLSSGKLLGEVVFERVGSGIRDAFVNSDCSAGGLVGRIYGEYLVTGYVDKKNNACNMPAPCACTDGVFALGMVYNGPANGTLYSFLKSNHNDTLGKYTGLYPGDTVLLSAEYINAVKLEDQTYFRLAGTTSDFIIPTKCGTYIQNESFGVLRVYGFVDATGAECNMLAPPNCLCVGGIKKLTLEIQGSPDTIMNYTVNIWANASHTYLLASYTNMNEGNDMLVSAAGLPNGELLSFTYVEIVGSTGGDIKIPTTCGSQSIVGETFDIIFVEAMEDSVGNKCEDLDGPSSCKFGKTLMCHYPHNYPNTKGAHQHCVKNKDVQKKLKDNLKHPGRWAIGACSGTPRLANPDDDTAIERIADGGIELSAFPNPFSESTTIRFRMPESSNVKLAVYSITGQEVASLYKGEVKGGKDYKFEFKAANHAYGMYFYRLETSDGKVYTNKLVLTK
jgi:hypothetical protein